MLLSNPTDPADSASAAVLKKGPWSAAEDTVLVEYVNKNGEGNWNAVQRNTGLQRCGKSCRLRWANHLRPNLKKGAFSTDEERLIIHLHSKLGNKWARISSHLPGRTDNEIKNYWNTRVKRRLRQGLPLYPNQNPSISTQTPKITPFQSSSYPITFNQNPQITTNQNTLSLFNPISLPSSFLPLHHPPPTLPPHFIRHCPNTFSGRTFSPPSQVGQYHLSSNGFGSGFGFDSGQVPLTRFGVEGFNFDNLSNLVELPSNQIVANNHDVVDDHIEDNLNVAGRAKSGLLDDLLQEAQIKTVNRGVKREREEDCELDWDGLASENSISGIKKELGPSQQMNLGSDDDISNILDLIPSLVQVPGWCNNGGGESPVDQSVVSVLSTENNYDGLDDNVPEPPPLTDLSPSDYDDDDGGDEWNPGSYNTWDNLP